MSMNDKHRMEEDGFKIISIRPRSFTTTSLQNDMVTWKQIFRFLPKREMVSVRKTADVLHYATTLQKPGRPVSHMSSYELFRPEPGLENRLFCFDLHFISFHLAWLIFDNSSTFFMMNPNVFVQPMGDTDKNTSILNVVEAKLLQSSDN